MLELITRKNRRSRCLTLAFLAATFVLSSCATQPKQPALVSDPDAQAGSSIPWNKPAKWEGRADVPGGLGGDPTFGGY